MVIGGSLFYLIHSFRFGYRRSLKFIEYEWFMLVTRWLIGGLFWVIHANCEYMRLSKKMQNSISLYMLYYETFMPCYSWNEREGQIFEWHQHKQYVRLQAEMYGQLESAKYGKIRPNWHSVTSSDDVTKFEYSKYFSMRKHIL